jgi:hypothetical protein
VLSRSLRADALALCALALVMSIAAYLFFRDHGTILGYKDTLSHLLIGRRVVVGQRTGFGQLGGIWLPLPHLLAATLAWNDSLYLSGLAGSVFSMASYVGTVVALYAVARIATGNRLAGWVAAAVYGLSANALYLQTTPMGEPLMYLGMVTAVLAVLLWYRTDRNRWLFVGALTCMLLVFVRYEAWVFAVALWAVVVHVCIVKKHRFLTGDGAGQAYLLVFGAYLALGVGLWLLWDLVIFGDALAWLRGNYTSFDQTSDLNLSQAHDVRLSALTYAYGVRATVGLPIAAAGVLGLAVMAWRERFSPVFTALLSTAAPGAFLVYGLYTGAQPMRVEEIDGGLYNLRMALVMVIPCALFSAYLVSLVPRTGWSSRALSLVAAALVVSLGGSGLAAAAASEGTSVATGREAELAYLSYAEQRQVGSFVEDHTSGRVLVQSFGNEWIVFPIQGRVVYEGSDDQWRDALTRPDGPTADIEVVVMRVTPGDTDTVSDNLRDSSAMADYGVVLRTDQFLVWQRGGPS